MKTVLFSLTLLAVLACGTKKIAGDGTGQTIEQKPDKKLTAVIGKAEMSTHKTTITSAEIKGNKLILNISYSGGCKEHSFSLVGSESIAKSMPPIRSVQLVHTGEEDLCKAMLMKTLEFDIRNLAYKQEPGSEIFLKIDGWDEQLKYTFE